MIYTVTLNPAIDKTVQVASFATGGLNRIESWRTEAGGKGINVAKAIHSLGHPCVAMGLIAGSTGACIEQSLGDLGIESDFVRTEGETRTNTKIFDANKNEITELNEPGQTVAQADLDDLEQKLFAHVRPGDIVILTGSAPPLTPVDTYEKWILELRMADVITILDADKELFRSGIRAKPTFVKPNLLELSRFCQKQLSSSCDIRSEARALLAAGISGVLVSLGEAGAMLFDSKEEIAAHSLPVVVESTVGAGDTMVAAWAVASECGMENEDMLRLAVAAASASIMSGRAGIFDKRTVDDLFPQVMVQRDF